MTHLPEIIQDLALILIAASLVTLICKALRQPVVIGYILAGVCVGPHISFLPTIRDTARIHDWGEIGIIFLLFALGLEFSFKRLVHVGATAAVTAVFEVSGVLICGFFAGRLLGWSDINSLFLGGILSISSTTIILRVFEEAGVKKRGFANLVFGILIIEDLVAVVLMVLLSTVALTRQLQGTQLAFSVLELAFFLVVWFLSGVFLIPTLLKRVRPLMSDETLLVIAIGLCFAMVVLAATAGFSPALGAFVMGSILAETREAESIHHLMGPLRVLFSAVFFVSVGLLIDPQVLYANWILILLFAAIVIGGKIVCATIGALLAGQSLKRSMQAGFSLAQIGEFSFVIAALGENLQVTSRSLYPIAVGVSVLTTLATPYLLKLSEPAYRGVERCLPKQWRQALASPNQTTRLKVFADEWPYLLKMYLLRMVLLSSLIIAIFMGTVTFVLPLIAVHFNQSAHARQFALALAVLASAPFFWALTLRRSYSQQTQKIWQHGTYRGSLIALEAMRFVVAFALILLLIPRFLNIQQTLMITLVTLICFIALFSKVLHGIYNWFERTFVDNLAGDKTPVTPALAPWDAHIVTLEIAPESPVAGLTLEEIKVRERFGVSIALISRGRHLIAAPTRHDRLLPHDHISVIGTDEQIAQFETYLQPNAEVDFERGVENYSLHRLAISRQSIYRDKTIRASGLREKTHGLVVGVERNGERILNPDSTLVIQPNDTLWLVAPADFKNY